MNLKLNEKIEDLFQEDSLINEAKYIIETAIRNNVNGQYNYIKNSKNSQELKFRIDFLKSILIEKNLIENKESDRFGNVIFLDCGEI